MTDEAPVPALPVTWRPPKTRIVAYTMAGMIMVLMIVLAVVVPSPYGISDRGGFIILGGFIAWVLHRLADCRVVADEHGLTVVNPFRKRRLEWAQVLGVNMTVGDPWPTLDLADGNSIGAMGIQGAEKEFAQRAVAELESLLRMHGESAEPEL